MTYICVGVWFVPVGNKNIWNLLHGNRKGGEKCKRDDSKRIFKAYLSRWKTFKINKTIRYKYWGNNINLELRIIHIS